MPLVVKHVVHQPTSQPPAYHDPADQRQAAIHTDVIIILVSTSTIKIDIVPQWLTRPFWML